MENNFAIVVPIRFASSELLNRLNILADNFEVVAVIFDCPQNSLVLENFKNAKPVKFNLILSRIESASVQRNFGWNTYSSLDIILFLDDDVEFEVEQLMVGLSVVRGLFENGVAAVANSIDFGFVREIRTKPFGGVMDRMGLYPSTPGKIAASGWHSYPIIDSNCEWLPSAFLFVNNALVRSTRLHSIRFYPFRKGSYLEDLIITWRLRELGPLEFKPIIESRTILAEKSCFDFGVEEIKNRYIFVELSDRSIPRFLISALLRLLISLGSFMKSGDKRMLSRVFGNVWGLLNLPITSARTKFEIKAYLR